MKLYLIRHSNAVEPGTDDYGNDNQRPLTENGCDKMKKIALALRNLGLQPSRILSSPCVRALQTAEILADVLKYKTEIAQTDFLVPMANADALIGEINEKYTDDELVLVGHEPSLSVLAGTLTSGNPEIELEFKKGGVCCMSADNLRVERKAALEWLLTPKILLKLSWPNYSSSIREI